MKKIIPIFLVNALIFSGCSFFGLKFESRDVPTPEEMSTIEEVSSSLSVAETSVQPESSAPSDGLTDEEREYVKWAVATYDTVTQSAAVVMDLVNAKDRFSAEWTAKVTESGGILLASCVDIGSKEAPEKFTSLHEKMKTGAAHYQAAIEQVISPNFNILKAGPVLNSLSEGTKAFKEFASEIDELRELVA